MAWEMSPQRSRGNRSPVSPAHLWEITTTHGSTRASLWIGFTTINTFVPTIICEVISGRNQKGRETQAIIYWTEHLLCARRHGWHWEHRTGDQVLTPGSFSHSSPHPHPQSITRSWHICLPNTAQIDLLLSAATTLLQLAVTPTG